MAREIERKFLVAGDAWRAAATRAREIRQAYLATSDLANVRVRLIGDGTDRSGEAWLTVKSAAPGLVRDEFEYAIPVADALAMLDFRQGGLVDKIRHDVPGAVGILTVDEFLAPNRGLVVAEIELPDEHAQPVLPDWLGREITGDRRFYNASLSARPFEDWTDAERAALVATSP